MATATKSPKSAPARPAPPPALERNSKAPHRHPAWAPGDTAHQGDLVFVSLSSMPKSAKPRANRQLAEGTTKGSRHIVAGGKVFDATASEIQKALERDAKMEVAPQYIGPIFSGPCTVEHPEHAHQVFPDHVCTAVVFQRNLDAEEREEKVRD